MTRTVSLVAILLLWAATASAWEIRIDGPVTIRGEGALPTLVTPVGPPSPPPLPPPPVVPPVTDTSPFVFPAQQPPQEGFDSDARYFDLCGALGGCYAGLPNLGNPLRTSHRLACITPMGMLYRGSQSIGGFRLYVPAGLDPVKIRTLCAGGAI